MTHWTSPSGGIAGYLDRFLVSGDPTFQHIAIWTLLQLLESEDHRLLDKIRQSENILAMTKSIADRDIESGEESEGEEESEREVVGLARKCVALVGGKKGLLEG